VDLRDALQPHLVLRGGENGPDVSQTFIQPFVSCTFPDGLSLAANTETTYDWKGGQWTVPLQAGVSKVFTFGKLPVSFALNGRYWAEGPTSAPD
jgi:hypothetical protein